MLNIILTSLGILSPVIILTGVYMGLTFLARDEIKHGVMPR